MAMDDTESCSSRAVDSSPAQPRQHRQKLEVFNEVLRRIQESDYEEAKLPDFDDQLWLHFNRLPARYALDVNVERAEDVLTHQRLLHLAEDPANRPVFEVRLVQVHSASYEDSVDSAYSNSPMKEDPQSYSNYSRRQGIHRSPTFGSSPNLEALAVQANGFRVEDGDSTVNSTSALARTMHEITLSTVEKPKLLSQLTSILAEVGLNIQEVHAFSTIDGFSLGVFVVDGWPYEETEQLRIAMEKEMLKIKRMSSNIVQSLQQPSGEESEKQSKAYWDDSTIDAFIKVCTIETLAGNRPNSHFNKLGWKNVIKAFNNLTGRNYQFMQLKNKWSSLKKDWQLWNTLIEKETNFGWDPIKQTINASNEWWDKKLKENPEAIKFKTKGLKNVEQLNILFKDIVVTSEGAWASSQSFVGQDVDDSSKVGDRKDNIIEGQGDSSCNPSLDTIFHSFEVTSQPSMKKENEGRRKWKRDETKSKVVTMQLERICSAVENRSSITSRADKPGCSIVAVMKIIRGIPEVKNDFELYMKAIDIMIVKENREMFIALEDPTDQIAWLKYKHV